MLPLKMEIQSRYQRAMWMAALLILLGAIPVLIFLRSKLYDDQPLPTKVISKFLVSHRPIKTFSLNELFPSARFQSLFKVEGILPAAPLFDSEDLALLLSYSKNCQTRSPRIRSKALQKALIWHRWSCQDLKELPDDFFRSPPWVHPLGNSYVYLAFHQKDLTSFQPKNLRESYKLYSHILEWKSLNLVFNLELNQVEKILSELNAADIEALSQNNSVQIS
jgi:hypothetical protein